jgi:hypothetical protein
MKKGELPHPATTAGQMQLPIEAPDKERPIYEPGTYLGRPPAAGKTSTSSRRSSTRAGPGGHPVLRQAPLGTRPTEGAQKLPRLSTPLATSAGQRREQQQQSELESAQILFRGEGLEVAGDGMTAASSSTSRRQI